MIDPVAWIAWMALAVLVVEALAIAMLPRFGVAAPALSRLAPTLLAGFFLVLTLAISRTALAPWGCLPPLAAALLAHLADLRQRWRSPH